MGTLLRVLLIEDSRNDAELLLHELCRGGYEPVSNLVDTAEGLRAALEGQEWDVVISDYSMPQFEGIEALRMVRDRCKALPFILVSGKIGEETAVTAMKAGANDYLMKDRLNRLTLVVQREIKEAHERQRAEETIRAAELERNRAEQELRDSVHRYRSLVLATAQAILSADAGGNIIADQPTWRGLTGQSERELLGRGWMDAIHPEDRQRAADWWRESVHRGELCECELRLCASDGGIRDVIARGVPVRDDEGLIREWVATCTDITERKATQAALVRHQLQLEQNNKQLADLYQTAQCFVDNVSHEFRTPLTVIKGYAEVIREGFAGPINDQQREFIEFILDRSRDLAQMVDDLLDSSKLRVGTLRVNRRPHPLSQVLDEVRPMILAKAATNKIGLEEEIDENLPTLFVDAEKVGRIILNLAVNAIKFSPEEGKITIWARPSTDGMVEIGVTDCGSGISPENLRLLFSRFRQVGDARNGTTKGFGLGLNIARELVALNFGDINVISIVGHGSTFFFRVPTNDPSVVIQRFIAHLDALETTEEMVCLFRINAADGHEITEALRGLLASMLRPTELLLDGPDAGSLLLVGCTGDPDRWLEHLRKSTGSSVQRQIEFEHLVSWQYPGEKSEIEGGILDVLHAEAVHA